MIAPLNFSKNDGEMLLTSRQLDDLFHKKGLLKQLEDSKLNLHRFAKENGINVTTLWRYQRQAELGTERLMDRRLRHTVKHSKVSDAVLSFVFAHKAAHPKTSCANIYRALEEQAAKENWSIPSYTHICRLVKATPNDLRTMLSESARVNWEKWGLCARRESVCPNALWQADATELDIWCLDVETGKLVKPWATVVIDCFSRVVLCVHITLREPTSADSLRALRNAILPKGREDHPFYGLPAAIQTDNHQVYKSADFLDTVLRLGINVSEIPIASPSANGKCERFHRTFRDQFLVDLAGYANQHSGLKMAKQSAIPFPLMQKLAEKFLVKYHLRHHSGIKGLSPWEQWHKNLADAQGLIFNAGEIKENFKIRKEVTLKRDGIEIEPGRHFSAPELTGYVGEKLVLRLPLDSYIKEVEAYHNGIKIGTLTCVEEDESLADRINSSQLARTIELQSFKKQMRKLAPKQELPSEESSDPFSHIQSSSKPKKRKSGNNQLQLEIPNFKMEE